MLDIAEENISVNEDKIMNFIQMKSTHTQILTAWGLFPYIRQCLTKCLISYCRIRVPIGLYLFTDMTLHLTESQETSHTASEPEKRVHKS